MIQKQKLITCPKCQKRLQVNNLQGVEEKVITCPSCGSRLRVRFNTVAGGQQAPAQQPIYDAEPSRQRVQAQQHENTIYNFDMVQQYQQARQPQQPQYQQPVAPPRPQPGYQQPAPPQPQYQPRQQQRPVGAPPPFRGGQAGPARPVGGVQPSAAGQRNRTTIVQNNMASAQPGWLEYKGSRYPLMVGQNSIGRACREHRAQVEILTGEDNTMSRIHAFITITESGGACVATIKHNPQATNKTYVNGKELTTFDEFYLTDGQVIQMGEVMLTYRCPQGSAPQQAPAPPYGNQPAAPGNRPPATPRPRRNEQETIY